MIYYFKKKRKLLFFKKTFLNLANIKILYKEKFKINFFFQVFLKIIITRSNKFFSEEKFKLK